MMTRFLSHGCTVVFFLMALGSPLQGQGWEWQHPLPQGQPLYDVAFANADTGWAVGWHMVIRTTNGGQDWSMDTLSSIPAFCYTTVTPNGTGWISGRYVYKSVDYGETWVQTGLDYSDTVGDIFFVDDSCGWVMHGAGRIQRTTDAGTTWASTMTSHERLLRIRFTDREHGWAICYCRAALHTEDGGEHWTVIRPGVMPVQDAEIGGDSLGWIVVDSFGGHWYSRVQRTVDGGATWTTQTVVPHRLRSIAFADSAHGWAVAEDGVILSTADGGFTWITQFEGLMCGGLYGVDFRTVDEGWAVGEGGIVMHTEDGGGAWISSVLGGACELFAGDFSDTLHGWAVGENGTVLATSDGGETWAVQDAITNAALRAVHFVTAEIGWLGGYGTIRKTMDGGQTWISQGAVAQDTIKEFSFADEEHGWAIGRDGPVFYTDNGGSSWVFRNPLPGAFYHRICAVSAAEAWLVAGYERCFHTVDGGLNWDSTALDIHRVYDLWFTDSEHGWALRDHNFQCGIWSTADGGETWQERYAFQDGDFGNRLYVASPEVLWVSVYNPVNQIVRSTDGGETWEEIAVEYFRDLTAVDSSHAWLIGPGPGIRRYVPAEIPDAAPEPPACATPQVLRLSAYPNPFNAQTELRFYLPQPGRVTLELYNTLGQRVARLADERRAAGEHTLAFDAAALPSGVYFARLAAADQHTILKLALLK